MYNIKFILEKNLAKNRYTNFTHPPYELEKELMVAIQKADFKTGRSILQRINDLERANLSKRPINSLKYSLIGSCTLFTRAIIVAGVDSETAFMISDYYINLIDESVNVKEIEQLEYSMLENFIDLIKRNKAFAYSPLINKSISYIKTNIESKILLQHIADYIGVHPNYLSTIFKKEVGKTVLEYINEERIRAIKIYLVHTDMPMNEISEIFGFANETYFSRFCKLQLEYPPRLYRKEHSK